MPYCKKEERESVAIRGPLTTGQLNYALTLELKRYWERGPKNYQTINDILGAVEGAKLEFYRRIVIDYEKEKCHTNGDVYT